MRIHVAVAPFFDLSYLLPIFFVFVMNLTFFTKSTFRGHNETHSKTVLDRLMTSNEKLRFTIKILILKYNALLLHEY